MNFKIFQFLKRDYHYYLIPNLITKVKGQPNSEGGGEEGRRRHHDLRTLAPLTRGGMGDVGGEGEKRVTVAPRAGSGAVILVYGLGVAEGRKEGRRRGGGERRQREERGNRGRGRKKETGSFTPALTLCISGGEVL